jgi:hypothetical protein
MLSKTVHSANSSSLTNNSSNDDNNNLLQLAHILAHAYGNALMHETPDTDLEASDLLLENAAVRFSSRLLYEITKGSCRLEGDPLTAAPAQRPCVLDDESIGLRALTDILSRAAGRLENLAKATPSAASTNAQRTFIAARIGSLAHLYRMVFALSRAHLDRPQSGAYLEAAREQLRFAREHLETERRLCECGDQEYTARLLELSQCEDQLKDLRDDPARH